MGRREELEAKLKDVNERLALVREDLTKIDRGDDDDIAKYQEAITVGLLSRSRHLQARAWQLEQEAKAIEKEIEATPPPLDPGLEYPQVAVPGATGPGVDEDEVFGGGPEPTSAPERTGPPVPLIAGGIAVLVAGGILLGGALAPAAPSATPSVTASAPAAISAMTSRPASGTAAPAAGTIRVNGQPAVYAGACSGYTVTFVWVIEGNPQPATFQRRTAKGNADYGPEEGPFLMSNGGPMTWDPATGRLTLRGATDSGTSPGFRSQITKIGGKEPTGDATSIAQPGYCQ